VATYRDEVGTVTTLTPVSGTKYTPSTTYNVNAYFQLDATVAGSYTLTMGPTTGAENTVANAVAMLLDSDDVLTVHIPKGWSYILTATSVTIGLATIIAV
jgi:hypothetical protein